MAHDRSTALHPSSLKAILEFAGFGLCHGLWTVHDGEDLPPVILVESDAGRAVTRFPSASSADSLTLARGNASSLSAAMLRTAALYDGMIRRANEELDAIVIELFQRGVTDPITLVQAYRPAHDGAGFRILGRPRVVEPRHDLVGARTAGFVDRGIAQHPAAEDLWARYWSPDPAEDLRESA